MQAWQALAEGRCSTRRFLDRSVPYEWIAQMLKEARRAPSGANLQPGEFVWIEGAARLRLTHRLVEAHRRGEPQNEDYSYFPDPMPMVLRRRQAAAAQALYGAIGAAREDVEARREQFERNFRFFDAPTALIVTIDSRMGSGCYMDLGMCLYGFMLAAAARGLASCAIGALASYPGIVREVLGVDASQSIVCGLSIGYADPSAPENKVRTLRRDVPDFLQVVQ
ncbi:MAG: nitroreductase [Proteobacteria bacterium]|nr:nitroreductase [Pseudomonadota bacterium]